MPSELTEKDCEYINADFIACVGVCVHVCACICIRQCLPSVQNYLSGFLTCVAPLEAVTQPLDSDFSFIYFSLEP